MTEFKLDLSDMQAAMATQIVASLTDEAREKIITEAVNALIAPQQREVYGGRKEAAPSLIQEAFTSAVSGMARTIAHDMIEQNPEVERRIREAAGAAILTWMEADYNLTGALADALAETFRNKLATKGY